MIERSREWDGDYNTVGGGSVCARYDAAAGSSEAEAGIDGPIRPHDRSQNSKNPPEQHRRLHTFTGRKFGDALAFLRPSFIDFAFYLLNLLRLGRDGIWSTFLPSVFQWWKASNAITFGVVYSWAIPYLGIKMDGSPDRINQGLCYQ